MLLRQRSGLVHDMRHVNQRDERQSRIAVDDREYLWTGSYAISSARSSPQSAAEPASPFQEATQRSYAHGSVIIGGTPVGIVAITLGGVGGFLVRSIVAEVENHDRSAAIPDEQDLAVRSHHFAIRARHRIHAVGARSAALRARKPAKIAVGAKSRDQVKGGPDSCIRTG